jgi:post-segregation antitoxin (ccd killing protein)
MSNVVSVVIPHELRQKASFYRVNVSKVCRVAVADEVEKIEKEIGVSAAKQNTPNTAPVKEGRDNVCTGR